MANGQTTASPVELNGAEIPEILSSPERVPQSRAFYSSHPDASDNISARPDAPEDIQFAVVIDSAAQSPNGRTEEITHASRFIALRSEHQETSSSQDFVILDHGLAVKGLKWIRKNVNNEDIHRSAVESLKIVKPPAEPEPVEPLPQATVPTPPSPSHLKSKRVREREERIKRQEESKLQHMAEREAEFEEVLRWKDNQPIEIVESFLEHHELLDSTVSSNGKISITENDGLNEAVELLVRDIMDDPRILIDEIQGEFFFSHYLETHDLPITSALYSRYNKFFAERFMSATYDGPEETKQGFKAWFAIYANLSDKYKQSLGYDDESREPALVSDTLDDPESRMHTLGIDILSRSFMKIAKTDRSAFIDLVHDTARLVFDGDDSFVKTNFMHTISTIMSESAPAAISVINAPILEGLDEASKLKAVDFMMALRQLPSYRQPMGYIQGESKEFRKHDKKLTALVRRHGLSGHSRQNSKLYEITAGPYMEAVKAGELEDSIYLRILESELPKNA